MSINSKLFYQLLLDLGTDFFVGVPDSTLKYFCAYITDNLPSSQHIITANEGGAIGLATGYYLATQKIPVVYMQNSGLGNAVNPLTSLTDPLVYGIPMLLIIGWRGEPGTKDEPQHAKQGLITLPLLDTLQIPYSVLDGDYNEAKIITQKAFDYLKKNNSPYALVVKKDVFDEYIPTKTIGRESKLSREQAINMLGELLDPQDIIVSTTGVTSRELFEYREAKGEGHAKYFLTVGSMGHASQIALGIALQKPDRQIYCLDGDGAAIMHLGSLSIIGTQKPPNFKHIIVNNGVHESVGGQPTVGFQINFPMIAQACGYTSVMTANNINSLKEKLIEFKKISGPALLEIKVSPGHRSDLGRPTTTPQENKRAFIDFLK